MNNLLIYPMTCLNNKNIESFEHNKKPSKTVQLSRGIGYEQQFVIGGRSVKVMLERTRTNIQSSNSCFNIPMYKQLRLNALGRLDMSNTL